jgi:Protein of unknown function (DUF2924)
MGRDLPRTQPASPPAEGLEVEVTRIGAMTINQLRATWRKIFASDPPPAFSKDLLARAIAFHAQQKALGGLPPATARLLRSLVTPGVEPPRQIKVGSVIVREHKGVVHEVLAVPGGFCWQGKTYDSLSTIAKTITGTRWNGPRFFGLRQTKDSPSQGNLEEEMAHTFVREIRNRSRDIRPRASDPVVAPVCAPGFRHLSARHETGCSQTPALRDLHPQVD